MRWGRTIVLGSMLAVASVTCFPPTEVMLDIKTDIECARGVRTGIAKGTVSLPIESSLETTTETCTTVGGTSEIGTLAMVPSDERDGRATVRVVVSVGSSFTPERCLEKEVLDNEQLRRNCIYATRTFSFLEHTSRRLPIFLSKDCLGKICEKNETCVPGGACKLDEVKCVSETCGLESELVEEDSGTPLLDAAPNDSSTIDRSIIIVQDAGIICNRTGPVAQSLPMPSHVAATSTHVYFFQQASLKLWRIDKATGFTEEVRDFTGAPNVSFPDALTTQSNRVIAGFAGSSTPQVWLEANGIDSGTVPVGGSSGIRLATSATTWPNVFAASGTTTFKLLQSGSTFETMADAQATLGFGATNDFLVAWSSGVRGIQRTTGTLSSNVLLNMPTLKKIETTPSRMVASAETVYGDGGRDGGLFELTFNPGALTLNYNAIVYMPAPQYFDVDGANIYFVRNNDTLARTTYTGGDAGVLVASTSGQQISFVLVDRETTGCVYYFDGFQGGFVKLRVLPKN